MAYERNEDEREGPDDQDHPGDEDRTLRRTFLKTTAAAAAVAIVGCGGDDVGVADSTVDAMDPDAGPDTGPMPDTACRTRSWRRG